MIAIGLHMVDQISLRADHEKNICFLCPSLPDMPEYICIENWIVFVYQKEFNKQQIKG
jgi:hypothetical protein